MKIDVPDEIVNDFLNLLDIAQSAITQEEIVHFSDGEKKCLIWIENLLGNRASCRWKTRKEMKEIAKSFNYVFGEI